MKALTVPVSRKDVAGQVPPDVAEAIRTLQAQVAALVSHAKQVREARYLTRQEADQLYGPKTMQKELSANGSAPLNVSNLLGRLAEVQP